MTSTRSAPQRSTGKAATPGLNALRGNCLGAAMLLVLQFAIGMSVNLYVTSAPGKAFLSAIFGSGLLAAHVVLALLLLGAAISALVRSVRERAVVPFTVVGLTAIIAAAAAGSSFVGTGADGASLAMALATAVAMAAYAVAVFRLR